MVTAAAVGQLPLLVEFDGIQDPAYTYLDKAPGYMAYVGVRSDVLASIQYTLQEAGDPNADFDSPAAHKVIWLAAYGAALAMAPVSSGRKHVGM